MSQPIVNNLHGKVLAKKNLAPDIYELKVRTDFFDFVPGQFLEFVGSDWKRAYSIASSKAESGSGSEVNLTFVIDVSPMGPGSKFVESLKQGDLLTMEGPYGNFVVPDEMRKDEAKKLIFVATGAGIAPFRSIIPDLLDSGSPAHIALIFGARSKEISFYFDFFEDLSKENKNFEFIGALSWGRGG